MNKTAFITGAGGYIGSQTAVTLAEKGINIAVCDINEETVERTVELVRRNGGSARAYIADVTDSKNIEAAMQNAADDFGSLDIMVHIAGGSARIAGGKYVPLTEQEDYVIDRVLKVNLYGAFWASRAAARIMIKQGGGGKIVNFASSTLLTVMSLPCALKMFFTRYKPIPVPPLLRLRDLSAL